MPQGVDSHDGQDLESSVSSNVESESSVDERRLEDLAARYRAGQQFFFSLVHFRPYFLNFFFLTEGKLVFCKNKIGFSLMEGK